jgi:hypothetical protein
MNELMSDKRNKTEPTISVGAATRCNGVHSKIADLFESTARKLLVISVSTQPGLTQFNRI